MKKIFTLITVAIIALSTASSIQASPAYPYPIKYTQPDGSVITIQLHGDEFLHWATCGNSLVAQDSDGYWRFATFNSDGTSNAQGSRVTSDKSGNGSNVTPPASAIAEAMQKREAMMAPSTVSIKSASQSSSSISIGENHFLVLLIQFSDKKFSDNYYDHITAMLSNSEAYRNLNPDASGSVKEYFEHVSNGKFSPVFDVIGPIVVPYTSAQCANDKETEAVKYACNYANDNLNVDFTQYCYNDKSKVDNVYYIFPGYNQAEGGGSDCIWPHAVTYLYQPFLTLDGVSMYHYSCTSEYKGHEGEVLAGIGTFCHEFGHVIGLPDYYDTDYATNGKGDGLFSYSLMSGGNYNNNGNTPPNMTTIERNKLGWMTEIPVLKNGNYTLKGVQNNEGFITKTDNTGEYLVYEARTGTGWDKYVNEGLLVYHVRESQFNEHNNIYENNPGIYFKAAYPSSLNPPHASEANVPYPGPKNVTSFDNNSPSPATDWSGKWHGDALSDIKYNSTNHEVTFTYTKKDPSAKTLSGKVTDYSTGAGISGASIKVDYVGGSKSTTTSTDGSYSLDFGSVSDPNFSISISKSGYLSLENESFTHPGGELTKNIIMVSTFVAAEGIELKRYQSSLYNDLSATGIRDASDVVGCIKFSAAEMKLFAGMKITEISFRVNNTVSTEKAVVWFGSDQVLDQAVEPAVVNRFTTVTVSSGGLTIPEGKDVYVGYAVTGAYAPYVFDKTSSENNGFYVRIIGGTGWTSWSEDGSLLISFKVEAQSSPDEKDEMYTLGYSGLNLELGKEYAKNATISLSLAESSDDVMSVTYYYDGTKKDGSSINTGETAGDHTIKAEVTYKSGKTETIIQVIKVQ